MLPRISSNVAVSRLPLPSETAASPKTPRSGRLYTGRTTPRLRSSKTAGEMRLWEPNTKTSNTFTAFTMHVEPPQRKKQLPASSSSPWMLANARPYTSGREISREHRKVVRNAQEELAESMSLLHVTVESPRPKSSIRKTTPVLIDPIPHANSLEEKDDFPINDSFSLSLPSTHREEIEPNIQGSPLKLVDRYFWSQIPQSFQCNTAPPPGYRYLFIYSSELQPEKVYQVLQRYPTAEVALLMGYALRFNKLGEDTSVGRFANIERKTSSSVEGHVLLLSDKEVSVWEMFVAIDSHWKRENVKVWMSSPAQTEQGASLYDCCTEAITYVARPKLIATPAQMDTLPICSFAWQQMHHAQHQESPVTAFSSSWLQHLEHLRKIEGKKKRKIYRYYSWTSQS